MPVVDNPSITSNSKRQARRGSVFVRSAVTPVPWMISDTQSVNTTDQTTASSSPPKDIDIPASCAASDLSSSTAVNKASDIAYSPKPHEILGKASHASSTALQILTSASLPKHTTVSRVHAKGSELSSSSTMYKTFVSSSPPKAGPILRPSVGKSGEALFTEALSKMSISASPPKPATGNGSEVSSTEMVDRVTTGPFPPEPMAIPQPSAGKAFEVSLVRPVDKKLINSSLSKSVLPSRGGIGSDSRTLSKPDNSAIDAHPSRSADDSWANVEHSEKAKVTPVSSSSPHCGPASRGSDRESLEKASVGVKSHRPPAISKPSGSGKDPDKSSYETEKTPTGPSIPKDAAAPKTSVKDRSPAALSSRNTAAAALSGKVPDKPRTLKKPDHRTGNTKATSSAMPRNHLAPPDGDVDNASDISLCVSSIVFSSRARAVPKENDIEVDLLPVFHGYERLHAAVCHRHFRKIPEAADTFGKRLTRAVEGVYRTSGPIRHTSAYSSAQKNLAFSRELLEAHYDKVHWDGGMEGGDDALATGYQLMEMTMSAFRNLLQVVEVERENLEASSKPEPPPDTTPVAPGTLRITTDDLEPERSKKNLFSRLRKLSLGCMNVFDISIPPTPVVQHPYSGSEETITMKTVMLSDDEDDDDASSLHTKNWFAGSVVSDSPSAHTPYTVKASLDAFPDPSPKLMVRPPLFRRSQVETDITRGPDGTIISATLPELVRIITDQTEVLGNDMTELLDAFFLFFRSFLPPAIFLDMLVDRFNEMAPKGLDEGMLHSWRLHQRFAKLQVVKLLCTWLALYWRDETDKGVLDRIISFTYGTVAKEEDIPLDTSKMVANSLCERSSGRMSHYGPWLDREIKQTEEASIEFPPTAFHARLEYLETLREDDFSMVDVGYFRKSGGAEELARQLTIIESELFHLFLPEELIHFADRSFQRKLGKWKAFCNGLSIWVVKSILDHREPTVRAQLVEVFISVAALCKTMRNYNSALAILLALQSSTISRLRHTEQIVSLGFRNVRGDLDKFFDARKNWREYRAELPQNLPAIPLTAAIIKDVKLNRELLPRVQSTVRPLSRPVEDVIPLQYYRNMRKTVRDLEKCYGSYKLKRVDFLYDWLKHHIEPLEIENYEVLSENLYQKSLLLEPKMS